MSKKTSSEKQEKNKYWETNEIICLLELAIENFFLKNMDSKTHRHWILINEDTTEQWIFAGILLHLAYK
jgi:hypothetical protein